VYVDGELEAAEARSAETHLVNCRECRALVLALRNEADLLADVLLERAPESYVPRRRAAPARGMALGFAPALALTLLASATLGALLEGGVMEAAAWLSPFQWTQAWDVAVDLVFWLQEAAPGLLELALSGAALASVSALGTFLLTVALRRWSGGTLALVSLLLAWVPGAQALELHHDHDDPSYTLPAGEVLEETLVIAAESVSVDGTLIGDLVVFARRVEIRGEVRGDVYAFVRDLTLEGTVRGSVHVVCRGARIAGRVEGDAWSACRELALAEGAVVAGDLSAVVESLALDGAVGRDLSALAHEIELRGSVARDLQVKAGSLALGSGARVGRDVDAVLHHATEIELASGAVIGGETRQRYEPEHHGRGLERFTQAHFYVMLVIHVGAAWVLGMLLHALLPGLFRMRIETAGAFFRLLGVGLLALVATPIALALAAVTLVGIPVALLGLALYAASLYVSGILIAALVGGALLRPGSNGAGSFGLALLAGVAILVVAGHLPGLGFAVRAVVLLAGLGLLAERALAAWRSPGRVAA
jgi:cytoskeletal protein CcmA (bactofilin family)